MIRKGIKQLRGGEGRPMRACLEELGARFGIDLKKKQP